MAVGYVYTGQFNAYVPKATGQIIAFAKDPKKYKLARWTQAIPVDEELFLYYKIHPDDFVRQTSAAARVWLDGQRRPELTGQRVRHDTVEGQCVRRDYDFQIGWRTLKVADYNVLLANTRAAENEAMIEWTQEALALGEDPTQWAGNTAQAEDLAGGAKWDQGTPEDPVIKRTLLALAEQITLNTNGVAGDFENEEDTKLLLVVAPQAARRMAVTPEIHAIYKESMYADAVVKGMSANPNGIWGLPAKLYGFTVVVETAVAVTERPEADGTHLASVPGGKRAFLKSPYSAIICSRPGGVDGNLNAPNYSTFQRYHVGADLITLQTFDEPKHEYTDGHVVRFGTTKLAAPPTGYLVQNILEPEA